MIMQTLKRLTAAAVTLSVLFWAAWRSRVPAADEPLLVADDEVHRAPGFEHAGMPAVADPGASGTLQLTILDSSTKKPTFARVNVVGPDGNFYEPAGNSLAPWSLRRLGNRQGKGPFRYYGWFFYAGPGVQEIHVPPGDVRVEAWKGFEYLPTTKTISVKTGQSHEVTIPLKHAAPVAEAGWYSGDTHIHLDRRSNDDDQHCLDLAEAEDIRFAHILCMNDPRTYQPVMEQQLHPQRQGLGSDSVRQRVPYQIASGQEYRANTYGHICLIGGSRLVNADGAKTDPNNWPPFGVVADELHALGGYAFHAHGGYGKEIYADFAQRATDGVELLQFAEYRDIGLTGWYHILNSGYQFPAVGASDYPYCRALGDCRTYCYLGDKRPTFDNWNKAAAEGRSFFTTGPLLWISVEDQQLNQKLSGETVVFRGGGQLLRIRVWLQSPVAPVQELQIIEAGEVRETVTVKIEHRTQRRYWDFRVPVKASTWVAARAFTKSARGREDVEAHTNPVYISIGETSGVQRASVEWLLTRLDERIAANAARDFPQKEQLLRYLGASREALAARLAAP